MQDFSLYFVYLDRIQESDSLDYRYCKDSQFIKESIRQNAESMPLYNYQEFYNQTEGYIENTFIRIVNKNSITQ